MNLVGIISRALLAANQAVVSSIAPVPVPAFSFNIGAGKKAHVKYWIPFSLGATGGFRFIISAPAAPTAVLGSLVVSSETTANTFFLSVQVALAAFANASAVASDYLLQGEFTLENGVNAGAVDLNFAQENSTAAPITLLRGAYAEVTLF
jgi:hypothetical protein